MCQPVSLRKRALRAGSWNLVSQVASQVMRLGGNLIMARLLLPEMFGVMVIATTVSVLLHLLSDVGLRQNIIQSHRGDDPDFSIPPGPCRSSAASCCSP
jgi:O-antigen/teichoic acid export membrane protein